MGSHTALADLLGAINNTGFTKSGSVASDTLPASEGAIVLHSVDPTSGAEDRTLPDAGLIAIVLHNGASNDITVKNSATTTIGTVSPDEAGFFVRTGAGSGSAADMLWVGVILKLGAK